MKNRISRILPLLLTVSLLLCCLLPEMLSANALDYENTYRNTGNQRKDIIGVALTQVGYTEGSNNDTKYGFWSGYPYQPWCATFISWCARQAEISTDILKFSAVASPKYSYFNIPYYSGDKYTPQPGDLFFTKDFSHVGLVYYTEGDAFYAIEGNGNSDGSDDGFCVIINKRAIANYYFGVPEYEGCDKDHDYVYGQEAAHSHRTYYTCKICGDQYYTGYEACIKDCSSCISCGCDPSYAGYYLVNVHTDLLNIRAGHGTNTERLGMVANGTAIYVYAADPSSGWAYIEYDGLRGHVYLSYLAEYYPPPAAPQISSTKENYIVGDTVELTWAETAHAEEYRLTVYRDRELIDSPDPGLTRSYTLTDAAVGEYEVYVTAANRSGSSSPAVFRFTVRDTYTVTFDARGGDAPTPQVQTLGQVLTICEDIPVRAGYTFLGWTDDPQGSFAVYTPGDTLLSDSDMTLYAVWKEDTATLQLLQIERLPAKTKYLIGDSLDTSGLVLRLTWSDGSGQLVTEGFTTEGFSSQELGTKTITVTYSTMTITYDVQIVTTIPGDMDGNQLVDRDDVVLLLWHINFPDSYPIDAQADFIRDGVVNRDDVMYLLWHINFPDSYPLETE